MKNFLRLMIIFILLGTFSAINAKYDSLKLVMQIDSNKVDGSLESSIISTKNYVFFFNDKGKCIKKMLLGDQAKYKISSNFKYICIAEQIEAQGSKVTIYNNLCKVLWEKQFPFLVDVLGISPDMSRILLSLETETTKTIVYLDNNRQIVKKLNEASLVAASENLKHWICRDKIYESNPKNIFIYNWQGKLIKQIVTKDFWYATIGNNGNFVICQNGKSELIDSNGALKEKYVNDIRLSKEGNVVLTDSKSFVEFQEIGKGNFIISQEKINVLTNKKLLFYNNLSQKGDIALYSYGHNPQNKSVNLLFVEKNGEMYHSNVNLGLFENIYQIHYEFIMNDKFLLLESADYLRIYYLQSF